MAMMVFDTNTKNEDNKEGDEDIVGSDKASASSSCEYQIFPIPPKK